MGSRTHGRRLVQQLSAAIDKLPRGRYRRLDPLQRHNRARPGFIVGYGLQVVSVWQKAAQFDINARVAACQEVELAVDASVRAGEPAGAFEYEGLRGV